MITQSVIDQCGLVSTGVTQVHDARGVAESETFLVNIALPNAILVTGVKVTKGVLPSGTHVLMGMDIIAMGDFTITNHGGITKFSFRVPSIRHIDFVEEINAQNAANARPQNRADRRRDKLGR